MKQCSALLNFWIVWCLVGEHPLRPSLCLLVRGETLSLNPDKSLFCDSRAWQGSVLVILLVYPFFFHLLFLVRSFTVKRTKMREGTAGEGRSREIFVLFCFEMEREQHIGRTEREGSMIWRKKQKLLERCRRVGGRGRSSVHTGHCALCPVALPGAGTRGRCLQRV